MIIHTTNCRYCKAFIGTKHYAECWFGSLNKVTKKQCDVQYVAKLKEGTL